MHFSTALVLASTVASAVAAPAKANKAFSTTEVRKSGFQKSSGFVALAKALAKANQPIPEKVQQVLTQGQVVATPAAHDREYTCPVTIGGQTVYLDFDTGSSDTWVFGPELASNITQGRAIYDYKKSKTAKKLDGEQWWISYGDGSNAEGYVVHDSMTIGGVTIPAAPIEVATEVASSFADQTEIGGLVGLAWPKLNQVTPTRQTPYFFQAIPTLKEPVFCAALKHNAPGSWDFGHVDPSKYTGEIHYTNIEEDSGFWQFHSAGVKVGSTAFANNQTSIADSGTSLLIMDPVTVKNYYAGVKDAASDSDLGVWAYPCTSQLPDLSIEVGNGYYAKIPGSLMTYMELTEKPGHCFGGIQENSGSGSLQILGDVLFKSQYVVHNGLTKQIGFADQKA